MASSDDRDRDSNTSPPKPDNPFIKFRQFADSQISSLLQGVLGIPSAFSKPNSSPRWDVFDEDLQRRDELMAKRQALKDSEARRQNAQSEEEKVLPVKTSPDWVSSRHMARSQSGPYRSLGHGNIDLPLYSPASKSLFQSLVQSPSDSGLGWGQSLPSAHIPYYLEPGQVSDDVMGMMRSMTYNNLSQSSRLLSEHSLIPYLLYSPYSPMLLHSQQMKDVNPATFINYNAAFVDLLATTYEKPLSDSQGKPFPIIKSFPLMISAAQMRWIDMLAEIGLLEDPTLVRSAAKPSEPTVADTSTEQDMYETFLRMAEHPAGATNTFESLFKEVERVVQKGVGPKEAATLREQRMAFVKEHGDSLRELEGMLSGLMIPFREAFQEEGNRAIATGGVEEPDRVVATKTITEHSTDEDGTIQTSVTVEKVFADGRVTTTHTSHIEDSSYQDAPEERDTADKDVDEEKKTLKKGWFWN